MDEKTQSNTEAVKKKLNFREIAGDIGKAAADGVSKAAVVVADKTKAVATKSQKAVVDAVDQNGDGKIDIEDIIVMGLKIPGIRINRSSFLQKELQNKFPKEVINDAISTTPLHANIPLEMIDKIADEVIKYERVCVSGISTALGMPGGVAVAATIPTDIAQYYGYMLRAAQKLMYLYGFPEINTEEKEQTFDSETLNVLTLCLGVMYGTAGAATAVKCMAKALASGVEKQLLRRALTKGTIYPIVRSVAKWFSIKMTKEVFAGFFKKAIPVIGGVIGGGITFVTFKPCCEKLKETLQNTMLSNPNYQPTEEEENFVIIEAEETDEDSATGEEE